MWHRCVIDVTIFCRRVLALRYAIKSGKTIEWPVIGVALQKNYISVYVAVRKNGCPIVQAYAGKLGELRSGRNNFSFERYDDLKVDKLSSLFAEVRAFSKTIRKIPLITCKARENVLVASPPLSSGSKAR